ncbi:MAG: radical SAM protein [Synergistaceae bacterium]|nr:radical SAM protein [Synergistaceae bacterium]
MYYRLKDDYLLRGWDKLPYAIVDRKKGGAAFITSKQMQALELCDGEVDVSDIFIPDALKEIIAEAEQKGSIEPCERGEGLKEFQKYKRYSNRFIRSAHWSITGKCNYKCKHCYMSAPNANAYEAPHEDIMKIIDMLAECGVMSVSLTGGEALTRKDFWEIVDALLEHGIVITQIYSNGALVNENVLKELDKRKIHPSFVMSFDGVDGWHDWLRGVTGAQKLVDRAFELCRDMGFDASASMTIHQGNKDTLRATINHLASLGVQGIKTGYVSNLGEWKAYSDKSVGIKDIFQAYLDYLPHYYEDGMPINVMFTSFIELRKDKPDKYRIIGYDEEYNPAKTLLCPPSRSSANISPDGRVLMCGMMIGMQIEKLFPTMPQTHFRDCIDFPEHLRLCDMRADDLLKANEKCRTCKFNKHCYGGCRGAALTEDESNVMAPLKSLCEMYYGGWIKKIVETIQKARPTAECPVKDLSLLQ